MYDIPRGLILASLMTHDVFKQHDHPRRQDFPLLAYIMLLGTFPHLTTHYQKQAVEQYSGCQMSMWKLSASLV